MNNNNNNNRGPLPPAPPPPPPRNPAFRNLQDFKYLTLLLLFLVFNMDTLLSLIISFVLDWIWTMVTCQFGIALIQSIVSFRVTLPFQHLLQKVAADLERTQRIRNEELAARRRRQQEQQHQGDDDENNNNNQNQNHNDALPDRHNLQNDQHYAPQQHRDPIFDPPHEAATLDVVFESVFFIPHRLVSLIVVTAICPIYSIPFASLNCMLGKLSHFLDEWIETSFVSARQQMTALQGGLSNSAEAGTIPRELSILKRKYFFFMCRAVFAQILIASALTFMSVFCFYHSMLSSSFLSKHHLSSLQETMRHYRQEGKFARFSSSAAHAPLTQLQELFILYDGAQHPALECVPGFNLLVETQTSRYGIKEMAKTIVNYTSTSNDNNSNSSTNDTVSSSNETENKNDNSTNNNNTENESSSSTHHSTSATMTASTHDSRWTPLFADRGAKIETKSKLSSTSGSETTKRSTLFTTFKFFGMVTREHVNTALSLLLLDFLNQALQIWVKIIQILFIVYQGRNSFPEYGDTAFFVPRVAHRLFAAAFAFIYILQVTGHAPRKAFHSVAYILEKIVLFLMRFVSKKKFTMVFGYFFDLANYDRILMPSEEGGGCLNYYLHYSDDDPNKSVSSSSVGTNNNNNILKNMCETVGSYLYQIQQEAAFYTQSAYSSDNDEVNALLYSAINNNNNNNNQNQNPAFFSFASSTSGLDSSWLMSQNSPATLPWYWQLVMAVFLVKYFDSVISYHEWTALLDSFKSLTPEVLREEVKKRRMRQRAREQEENEKKRGGDVLQRALSVSQSPAPERPPVQTNNNNNANGQNNQGGRSLSALSNVSDVLDLQCCICLDTIDKDRLEREDAKILSCSHVFHGKCLGKSYAMVNATCPVCRAPMWPRANQRNNNNNNQNNRNQPQQQQAQPRNGNNNNNAGGAPNNNNNQDEERRRREELFRAMNVDGRADAREEQEQERERNQ